MHYNFFASIATLAALVINRPGEVHSKKQLTRLHEMAERFSSEILDLNIFESIGVFDIETPPLVTSLLSITDSKISLRASTKLMLATPTIAQQLKAIEKAITNNTPLPMELSIWETPAGRAYQDFAESGITPPTMNINTGGSACPHCYTRPTKQNLMNLEKYRFAQCSNCQKFITDSL